MSGTGKSARDLREIASRGSAIMIAGTLMMIRKGLGARGGYRDLAREPGLLCDAKVISRALLEM